MVAARSDHICVLKQTLFHLMYFMMYFREQECFFFLFQSALQNASFENGSVAFILRVNISSTALIVIRKLYLKSL